MVEQIVIQPAQVNGLWTIINIVFQVCLCNAAGSWVRRPRPGTSQDWRPRPEAEDLQPPGSLDIFLEDGPPFESPLS